MSWFAKLFGKSEARTVSGTLHKDGTTATADWVSNQPAAGLARVHRELLSRFLGTQRPDWIVENAGWRAALGKVNDEPAACIARFRQRKWLIEPPLADQIGANFKAADLHSFAKTRGLKVSGHKDELARSLARADPEGMAAALKGASFLAASGEGRAIGEAYVVFRKQERTAAQQASRDTLERGDLEKAAGAVSDYQRKQVFPAGLNIDWGSDGEQRRTVNALRHVQAMAPGRPAILSSIDAADFNRVRRAAMWSMLWGEDRDVLDDIRGIKTHRNFDGVAAARMLTFYASHLDGIEGYRKAAIPRVRVIAASTSCPECLMLAKRSFPLSKAPELPHPKCTYEMGCRCVFVADFDK
jgi:hypothetical protein